MDHIHMKIKVNNITILMFALVLLSGCVAPGSRITHIGLSGEFLNPQNAMTIKAMLPKEYGLGGLDLVMNKPEDFGHTDQVIDIDVIDSKFSYEFPPMVTHISFWILPPLGGFPRNPPAPFYFIRFSNVPDETYLIGIDKNDFRYKVFNNDLARSEFDPAEAYWNIVEGRYTEKEKTGVWYLNIRVEKNPKEAASMHNGTGAN